MAEQENSKDLISVLWNGADILRSMMDANEYKNYLLGIVFYKYLSDSFLIKVYDLIYDEKPESMGAALDFHHQLKGAILDAVDDGLIARDPTRKAIIKGKTPKIKKIKYLNQFELHTHLLLI